MKKSDIRTPSKLRWHPLFYGVGTRIVAQRVLALADRLGNAFLGSPPRRDEPVDLLHLTGGVKAQFDPWPLLEHLGEFLSATFERREYTFGLPRVDDVLAALLQSRLKVLRHLQRVYASVDDFMAHFHFGTLTQRDKEEAAKGAPMAMASHLLARDLLIGFIRVHYRRPPAASFGWLEGLWMEMDLLRKRIPAQERWDPLARAVWKRFARPPENWEHAGFVLPEPAGRKKTAGDGGGANQSRGRRSDPERLLFYLAVPVYICMRTLDRRNPYHYVGIQFTNDRFGLDSEAVGNRFFGLCGPLEECIALAQRTKGDIAASPLCKKKLVHDPSGHWRDEVRDWLAEG